MLFWMAKGLPPVSLSGIRTFVTPPEGTFSLKDRNRLFRKKIWRGRSGRTVLCAQNVPSVFPPWRGVFGIAEREGDGGIEFHKSDGAQQGRGGGPQDGSRPVDGRALLPDHHVRGDSYTKIRVDRSRGAGQRRSPATRPWNNRINSS